MPTIGPSIPSNIVVLRAIRAALESLVGDISTQTIEQNPDIIAAIKEITD